MDEYISREMAIKKLQMQLLNLEADQDKGEYSELCENRGARDALDEAIYAIRTIKAADVQPVVDTENMAIAEYKRLLKAAVEDIHELLCDKKNLDGNGQSCNICSYIEWCPCCKECTIREDLRNWRYADEALKLLEKG